MPYTYSKLRGRIVEKYGNQETFAKSVNVSKVSVSKKLNGLTGFSQMDIESWAGALGIPKEEYPEYFFT